MLDELVRRCLKCNVVEIIGYYYKSPKNNMVSGLYERFGFTLEEKNEGDTIWKLNIENYNNKNKLIGITHD
jgi:predicted enzyme involved in methoxymalonyl-ACP biosynthesis